MSSDRSKFSTEKGSLAAFPECDRTGPLFGPNPLKLGVFGLNVSSAGGITAAGDRHEIDWAQNVRLTRQAEDAGFEATVPFARWRGFEGATNPWGQSFETYTWAAGLAAASSRIAVFSTSHVLTVSPILAAKQLSTIDHISSGRAALNTVSGWFQKELAMFGVGDLDHDARYAYAEEWMEILIRLWTQSETFDYAGRFFNIRDAYQQPKSIQTPRPPVMNAGYSPVGNDFAARWADIAFIAPDTGNIANAKAKVGAMRQLAAGYGRTIQVWMTASVLCAETEAAAQAEVSRYTDEQGDPVARANAVLWTMSGAQMPAERREAQARKTAVGLGYPLVGTAKQIAESMTQLSEVGVDGLCMTWVNYERGLQQFVDDILPLLERSGLRHRKQSGRVALDSKADP